MSAQPLLAASLALLAAVSLAACQSTQSRSAELEGENANVLLEEEGVTVTEEDPSIEVVSTTVLSEAEGSALVVELRNKSGDDLVDVPISVDVLDAKGNSVYKNDAPGLEQALVAVPFIAARGEAVWVNDQVLAVGKPVSAEVKVGVGGIPYDGEQPEIDVSEPVLEGDPTSGIVADGDVVNRTGKDQNRFLIYGVARQGNKVVAAGRGAIEHLKPEAKKVPYNVYFIGDPSSGELTLYEYPTLEAKP